MAHYKTQFEIELDAYENFIDVHIESLDEKWSIVAKEVLGETADISRKGIQMLKDIAKREYIVLPFFEEKELSETEKQNIEELFWLKVLRAGGMDITRAWEVFTNYLNIMKNHPNYFEKAYPPTQLKLTYEQQIHNMLEHRDQNGRRVYVFRPGRWDPDIISVYDVFCGGYALSEMISMETKTQITGVTVIADPSGFGFKQLRHFTLDLARNATNFVQDSFPLWYRSIHVINAPRFFLVAFNLVKPFLNERIKNNLHFHDSLESLHTHVPKEILPSELGGTQGHFDNSNAANAVFKNQLHFTRVQQFVHANNH